MLKLAEERCLFPLIIAVDEEFRGHALLQKRGLENRTFILTLERLCDLGSRIQTLEDTFWAKQET